jgi:hypothetical protein
MCNASQCAREDIHSHGPTGRGPSSNSSCGRSPARGARPTYRIHGLAASRLRTSRLTTRSGPRTPMSSGLQSSAPFGRTRSGCRGGAVSRFCKPSHSPTLCGTVGMTRTRASTPAAFNSSVIRLPPTSALTIRTLIHSGAGMIVSADAVGGAGPSSEPVKAMAPSATAATLANPKRRRWSRRRRPSASTRAERSCAGGAWPVPSTSFTWTPPAPRRAW